MNRDMSIMLVNRQGAMVVKKKTRSPRMWIRLDGRGQSSLLDMDKHAIMHRLQIHARDLRILDSQLYYPSKILVREKAILLNLEHIKAIITAEEVLLRDPTDKNVLPVVEELQSRLSRVSALPQHDTKAAEYESPLEFRALEVALESICSFLAARTTELEMAAYPALDDLTSKISSHNLDRVRKLKSSMTRLSARVQKVRDEIEQLLDDDDDDMAGLYLSRKLAGSSSPVNGSSATNWFAASPTKGSKISKASRASLAKVRLDENVEEIQMLLEAYLMRIDGTLNKLITLREYIDDTEDYINIRLDNIRNQLIQLEVFLNSAAVAVTFYSMVTGIFGMSIPYSWNQGHSYLFKWVVIVTTAVCAGIFLVIIAYARKKRLIG